MEEEMARRSLVLDQAVESEGKKKSRKKLIVGIAMLGVIPVIGSTLAASITIGSGNIEFGQGYRAVVACDDDVTIALNSTYSNTSNFTVSTVTLSGVNDTACANKTLTVKLRNSSGTVLDTLPAPTVASGTTSYTLTPTTSVDATAVSKVTIESS